MGLNSAQTVPHNREALLDSLPKHQIVAELGTFAGEFAVQILRRCSPNRLYVVDLFRGVVHSGDQDGENMRALNMERMREILTKHFALTAHPVSVETADSISWLRSCYRLLDWCYIDTTHTLEQTWEELHAAAQAVKLGGYIMGHDYAPQYGVVQAVDMFTLKYGFTLRIWDGDKIPSYQITNERPI